MPMTVHSPSTTPADSRAGEQLLQLADGVSGATIGFLFYGSWAVWANFDAGLEVALRAGLLQGTMSFIVTLSGTGIMKRLFAGNGPTWWRFCRAFGGAMAGIYVVIVTAHLLNGTPNILLTLAPGLPITTFFCLSFCLGLARYGDPARTESQTTRTLV